MIWLSLSRWLGKFLFWRGVFALALLIPSLAAARPQPVAVSVESGVRGPSLSPGFLGLSYETSMLLPQRGRYYFDAHDQALINTFRTLGIQCLRVGGNSVDNPRIAVPNEKDIDLLFRFARAAGIKVIYSFRLKQGDPAQAARLAAYIEAHHEDGLDCFAIGNEPDFYLKTFSAYYAKWKTSYDAILKAVPDARFDGPSVAVKDFYAVDLAKAMFAGGHLAMASDHYYFLGSGPVGEKHPAATRARFLSNRLHATYERDYAKTGAVLASDGVPYRIDEMNSCYDGGAKGASDTYASALWALDCTHWWAAHDILGVNYHTGESAERDGQFRGANYAAFVHRRGGHGFAMRPLAYGLLAFRHGAHGQPLGVKLQAAPAFNFDAYAYRNRNGAIYVTLINKSYGDRAELASVSVRLLQTARTGAWQRMDLRQRNQDVAAKTGVTLGGAAIDPQGIWAGHWKKIKGADSSQLTIQVVPASAAILRFSPEK